MTPTYIGRFAPSPTGPLHFGSLLAAAGSYLDARAHGGRWYVRMEDLDPPREVPGAAAGILHTLEAFGFEWDGDVIYQGRRHAAYEAAVDELLATGAAFRCACSRREIADSAVRGLDGPIYPGTCRNGVAADRDAGAVRLRVPDETLEFDDLLRGPVHQNMARDVGDFIIRRADGCYAYQLAVVLDDAWQGVTHVVRGADLILSTPRQLLLQRVLRLPTPVYMHLPVALNARGEKLSKQTHAAPIDNDAAPQLLWDVLQSLRQNPPRSLAGTSTAELLAWAVAHWQPFELRTVQELIIH
jgi:glutamyl-Q tRNA(Asp) synthetase